MPIHNAAHPGHLQMLKLLHNPPPPARSSDVNATTVEGCTPLHLAAIVRRQATNPATLHADAAAAARASHP